MSHSSNEHNNYHQNCSHIGLSLMVMGLIVLMGWVTCSRSLTWSMIKPRHYHLCPVVSVLWSLEAKLHQWRPFSSSLFRFQSNPICHCCPLKGREWASPSQRHTSWRKGSLVFFTGCRPGCGWRPSSRAHCPGVVSPARRCRWYSSMGASTPLGAGLSIGFPSSPALVTIASLSASWLRWGCH